MKWCKAVFLAINPENYVIINDALLLKIKNYKKTELQSQRNNTFLDHNLMKFSLDNINSQKPKEEKYPKQWLCMNDPLESYMAQFHEE